MVTLVAATLMAAGAPARMEDEAPRLMERVELEYRSDDGAGHDDAPVVNLTLLDAPVGDSAATQESVAGKPFGAEGTRWLSIQGAFGAQFTNFDNRFYLGGVGASWFVLDQLAIEVQLNGVYFSQRGADAAGVNARALLRYHFLQDPEKRLWSLYVDGGAGILVTTHDVPRNGSSFNFTPQVGVGVTWALSESVRLFFGGRWLHISNANTYRSNPGRDSYEVYAGVMFPF